MRHISKNARPSRGGDGRAQERATGEVAHLHSYDITTDIHHLSPPQYHSASTDGPGLDEALLAHALAYAARGWPVLPCRPRGKEPLVAGGYQAATTDPATIRGWWTRWPEANIGIPTGRASGLVVLDIDPRNGGDAALLALPPLPDTVEVVTGGGGRHIYFRAPDREIRCRPNALGLGLDLKADGGYVLVPPSVHPSGRPYQWGSSSHPDDVAIAPMPDWLIERLMEPEAASATRAEQERIPEGRRNATLARIAGALRRQGLDEAAIRAALLAINREHCDPPLPDTEVASIARSIARYPAGATAANAKPADGATGGATSPAGEIVTVPLAQVQAEPVAWLWPGWIPRGRLTLIAGHPGAGKSFFIQQVAAAVSSGRPLPGTGPQEPADVILIALEDDPADTLRPRLEAMGADLARVHVYRHVVDRRSEGEGMEERNLVFPRDAGLLADLIRRHNAALVVIDPLVAVQDPALDSHRQAAMRGILGPLHVVAQETGAALVIVAHLRKTPADLAMLRVGGSIDLVAAARVVIVVAPDPGDESPRPSDRRRVAAVAKSNLSAIPDPVAFSLRGGQFSWDTTPVAPGTTAETLLTTPEVGTEERSALEEAMHFLREALAAGPRPVKELQREAAEAGISPITLRRARERLGVRPQKLGVKGGWSWVLIENGRPGPEDDHHPPEDDQDDHIEQHEHLRQEMIIFGGTFDSACAATPAGQATPTPGPLAREGEACPSCGAQVVESPPSGSSLDWRWDSTQKRWVKAPGWWQSIPVSPRRRGR